MATDRRRVTGKQIEREAEGRRSRLPSMLGGHGDGTRQASCDREADREGGGEVRRSRLPSMSEGHGDGQASVAWSSRSLQTSSGHWASEDWGSRSRVMSRCYDDGTRLRGGGLEEIAVDVDGEWLGRRQFYFSWGSQEALMRSA